MLRSLRAVVVILIGIIAVSAGAAVTVSSFDTQAEANAYAPLDKSAYFATDDKPNASPAVGDVSADWLGTNLGGSTTTWEMVAAAQINTVTTTTGQNLTITGAGSFSYDLTTTTGFIDPTSQTVLYAPEAAADYQCYFSLDTPASYNFSALLGGYSALDFFSVSTGSIIFSRVKFGGAPSSVATSGTVGPGDYGVGVTANFGPPDLPPGVNDSAATGSFSGFSFSVVVPEPRFVALATALAAAGARRARRSRVESANRRH